VTDKDALRELNRLYLICLYSINGRQKGRSDSVGRAYQQILDGLHRTLNGVALHGSWRRRIDELRDEWMEEAALCGNGGAETLLTGWADSLNALIIFRKENK